MKKYLKFIIPLAVGCFIFSIFFVNVSQAADCNCANKDDLTRDECKQICGSIMGGVGGNCRDYGNCELNDFIRIVVKYFKTFLGLTGSLALLFFIYGGVMFLISGGSAEKVTQAKQIIISAVVGLVIIFSSYMIIDFVFTALGYNSTSAFGDWFEAPK